MARAAYEQRSGGWSAAGRLRPASLRRRCVKRTLKCCSAECQRCGWISSQRNRPKLIILLASIKVFSGQMSVFRALPSADPSRGWIKIVSYRTARWILNDPCGRTSPLVRTENYKDYEHTQCRALFFLNVVGSSGNQTGNLSATSCFLHNLLRLIGSYGGGRPLEFPEGVFTDDDDWTILDWCRVCDTIPASAELLLWWDILYGYELWPWVCGDGNTK